MGREEQEEGTAEEKRRVLQRVEEVTGVVGWEVNFPPSTVFQRLTLSTSIRLISNDVPGVLPSALTPLRRYRCSSITVSERKTLDKVTRKSFGLC